MLSFTGDQKFLDSLQRFPRDFPFNIRIANVYIRGGWPEGPKASEAQDDGGGPQEPSAKARERDS